MPAHKWGLMKKASFTPEQRGLNGTHRGKGMRKKGKIGDESLQRVTSNPQEHSKVNRGDPTGNRRNL